jgi:predicted transcriptional regulator
MGRGEIHGREKTGEISQKYKDDEYLDAVRENEPAGTSEVAESVGVERQSADYRLRKLEDEGRVKNKMVGNSLVWMVEQNEASRTDTNPDGLEEVVE